MFYHRHGLAGDREFVDVEFLDAKQPQIGADVVARLEEHDVAGHKPLGGDALFLSAAPHGRLHRDYAREAFDGIRGFRLLQKPDNRVDQHDGKDHAGVHPLVQKRRDAPATSSR